MPRQLTPRELENLRETEAIQAGPSWQDSLAETKSFLRRLKRPEIENLLRAGQTSTEAEAKARAASSFVGQLKSDPLGYVRRGIIGAAVPLSFASGGIGAAASVPFALEAINNLVRNPSSGSAVMAGLSVIPGVRSVSKMRGAARAIQATAGSPDARALATVREATKRQAREARRGTEVPYRADIPSSYRSSESPYPSYENAPVYRPPTGQLPRNVNRLPVRPIEKAAERQLTRGVQVGRPSESTSGATPEDIIESLRGAAGSRAGREIPNPQLRATMEAMFRENNPVFRKMVDAGMFRRLSGQRVPPMEGEASEVAERVLTRGAQVGRADEFTDYVPVAAERLSPATRPPVSMEPSDWLNTDVVRYPPRKGILRPDESVRGLVGEMLKRVPEDVQLTKYPIPTGDSEIARALRQRAIVDAASRAKTEKDPANLVAIRKLIDYIRSIK